MEFNINELKKLMSKINLAVEKSKINPKSGWIELETTNESLNFKVSNYDYYLEASVKAETYIEDKDRFHVTVLAETFIPLISKLDATVVNMYEKLNVLNLETDQSSYTFPVIKEMGVTKSVDTIAFKPTTDTKINIDSENLVSVATVNTKGLVDSVYSSPLQQFIYVDEKGGITFTENIYVNEFKAPVQGEFKLLLTATQAKLLEIFKDETNVEMELEQGPTYDIVPTTSNKVCISNENIKLILITQNQNVVDKFPAIKLRTLAENVEQTHVVIDKKQLDKALARLMVFDKKFDITVMDYSKIVFKDNEMELVSIKNKNFERIPYISSQNVVDHESIIRFADLVNQLKAITSKEIDISFGSRPAIVINGNVKQVIPEIRTKG